MNQTEMMNEQENNTEQKPTVKEKVKEWVRFLLPWALGIFICTQVIGVGITRGHSMEPTMHDWDLTLILKTGYTLRHGDVIIFKTPVKSEHKNWVKRVIGLPGDVLQFDEENQVLYRNGEVLDEPYLAEGEIVCSYLCGTEPFTVQEGYVFVMGDNRQHSTDSRFVGAIPMDHIIGKLVGYGYSEEE